MNISNEIAMVTGEYGKKLLNVLPESTLIVTKDGCIVFANRAALEFLERPAADVVGHNLLTLAVDPPDRILDYLLHCSQTNRFHIGILTFTTGQGLKFPCRCDGAFLGEDGGRKLLLIRHRPQTELSTPFAALNEQIDGLNRARHGLENEVRVRTAALLEARKTLRELSAQLMQAQDEERRRLARELHDSTGQMLTAIQLNLSILIDEDAHLPPESRRRLAQTIELTNQAIGEVRTISHLLHPPLLDEAGLPLALRNFIEGFEERSKISVAIDLQENLGRVALELETALFRIVQECLTNVHRHSGSGTASVRVAMNDGHLELEVRDHGKGISADPAVNGSAKRTGVGVSGMRERVRLLGGVIEFLNTDPGTLVKVKLPCPSPSSARLENNRLENEDPLSPQREVATDAH